MNFAKYEQIRKRILVERLITNTAFIFVLSFLPSSVFAQQFLPRIEPPQLAEQPTPPTLPTKTSVISVPLSVPLNGLFDQLESKIPKEADASQSWIRDGGKGIKYRLWRDPLKIDVKQNLISTKLDNHYWLKSTKGLELFQPLTALVGLFTKKSCGKEKEPLELHTTINTNFELKNGWDIGADTKTLSCLSCQCRITFKQTNATSLITDLHQNEIDEITKLINLHLNGISFRPTGERAWQSLQPTFELTSKKQWLSMEPREVDIKPVTSNGQSIESTISFFVQPIITETEKPQTVMKPLPDPKSELASDGFYLYYNNLLSYDDATEDLEDKIVGNEYQSGENTAQITGAVVSASGTDVVIKVRTTGSLKSTLYLIGKLQADTMANEIYVSGLDFTKETKQTLADNSVNWLDTTNFRKSIGEAAKWTLQSESEKSKKMILTGINRQVGEDMSLVGSITNQSVSSVIGSSEGFIAQTLYKGYVQIKIQ